MFSCLIGFALQLGDMTNMQLPLNSMNRGRDVAIGGKSYTKCDLALIRLWEV